MFIITDTDVCRGVMAAVMPSQIIRKSLTDNCAFRSSLRSLTITAAVVRASAILRSQRGRKQPPARKVRGAGPRKTVKVQEPVA